MPDTDAALDVSRPGPAGEPGRPAAGPRARRGPSGGPDRTPALDSLLAAAASSRAAAEPDWLVSMRAAAAEALGRTGFPTTRDEAWRFTPLAPLTRLRYAPAPPPGAPGSDEALSPAARSALEALSGCLEPGPRLVFVNGWFVAGASSLDGLPEGVAAGALSPHLDAGTTSGTPGERSRLVRDHLGAPDAAAFPALNAVFFRDGAFVHVSDGTDAGAPIQLVYLADAGTAAEGGAATHRLASPRNLIVAGRASRLSIVEIHASATGERPVLSNAFTRVVVGDGAVVEHGRIGREEPVAFGVSDTRVTVGRDGDYRSRVVCLGGSIARNDLTAVLDGPGARCTLDGLFVTTGRQHVDNHTLIDHARPHTSSEETYKGILDGASRGVFDGRVLVRADAQKIDARQSNRNLLLSDSALVNTKPQLEINADDVRCAHAATIGRLNEDSVFYLRSRGLDAAEARDLLIRAFASEVADRIPFPAVRAWVTAEIGARLSAGAGKRTERGADGNGGSSR